MTPEEQEQAKLERDSAVRQVQKNLTAEASQMLATQGAANDGTAAAMIRAAIQTGHEMGAAHANELGQGRAQADQAILAAEAIRDRLGVRLEAAEAKIDDGE